MSLNKVARGLKSGRRSAAKIAVVGAAVATAATVAVGAAPSASALDVNQQVYTAGPLLNLLPLPVLDRDEPKVQEHLQRRGACNHSSVQGGGQGRAVGKPGWGCSGVHAEVCSNLGTNHLQRRGACRRGPGVATDARQPVE